tara:strand:+ start:42 stop:494 length:453 start_codon:yes stop_codon:yes gene_type:complete
MATYTKYNTFVGDLAGGSHDLIGTAGSTANTVNVALSNTAPNAATHTVLADITEIAAGNGYSAGGASTANVGSNTSGTVTVTSTNVTFTAATSSMATFRYVVAYNVTQTSPNKPLIAYWDYGAALTLAVGESLTVKFNGGASSGTLFTLT